MDPQRLPIRVSLPASVASWLASVTRVTTAPNGDETLMPRYGAFSATTEGVDPKDLALGYRVLNDHLAAGSPMEITAEVTALLSHYFMPELPPAVYAQVMEDWTELFATVPLWALRKARMEWLAAETRRPTPADIRAITSRLTWNETMARRIIEDNLAKHPALAKPGAVVPA